MTHITQAQLDEWKRDAEKATPGPWEVDDLQNEGDYGNGEDVHSGFTSYVVCAGNKSVVDTLNSDLAMVEVDGDCDENGPRSWAWDETGRRNATHIANASPANFLALIAALEEAREALKPGWAIFDNGQILVTTVSPTRRGAIINWLVTERAMMVFNEDTDEKIEEAWQSMKLKAECCEVSIRRAAKAGGVI